MIYLTIQINNIIVNIFNKANNNAAMSNYVYELEDTGCFYELVIFYLSCVICVSEHVRHEPITLLSV
jgi:hypothetical protein